LQHAVRTIVHGRIWKGAELHAEHAFSGAYTRMLTGIHCSTG
jgi:hypothetical protein